MEKYWILIYVYHGIIQEPEIFTSQKDASKRQKEILEDFNPDYDEVEIFAKMFKDRN